MGLFRSFGSCLCLKITVLQAMFRLAGCCFDAGFAEMNVGILSCLMCSFDVLLCNDKG